MSNLLQNVEKVSDDNIEKELPKLNKSRKGLMITYSNNQTVGLELDKSQEKEILEKIDKIFLTRAFPTTLVLRSEDKSLKSIIIIDENVRAIQIIEIKDS
jgi:hypothetical protein